MLREYSWDMTGYKPKSVPNMPDGDITKYTAERIFQLEPEPPVEYSLTELGKSLKPILDSMLAWGEAYKAKH